LKNFEDKYDPEEYLKVVEETSSIIEELVFGTEYTISGGNSRFYYNYNILRAKYLI
jgi:hypothetical protein